MTYVQLKTLEYWRTKINKKSKYFWENDHAHSGYAYNRMDSWKGEQLSFLFDFIDREFEFDSKSICLDIGCNSALNLKYFKEKYYNKDNEYYGFDLNETALNNARENIPEGSFKKCILTQISFPNITELGELAQNVFHGKVFGLVQFSSWSKRRSSHHESFG